ncbi:hypothetical protein [Nocardia huaxiensis]|uniref:Uncharacterized protein n=1 Tax=Nocardia huaxiensis TaxID=2755382 RepID=A0A7D6ZEZ9_9NOCA|nr:hypothetical protein [Nocardia huaxiensis]QLY28340.1 hypothetical protein H0264_23510 [Nocardia huaxiensis]UFS98215.1 hypothetical protein LPY97_10125 [Nocardia huaxiensis]
MKSFGKRMLVSAAAATLLGSGVALGAAPAQAQPWWGPECAAYPVNNSAAYSTCYWFGWHQVKIQCRHWWGYFGSSWATYERRGPVVWGAQQSWAHCDTPGTLQRWEVVTFGW